MSKNSAKFKKNKKLRRELEILKAQLKSERNNNAEKTTKGISEAEINPNISKAHKEKSHSFEGIYVDDKLVKKGLLKTLILSAGAFAVIIALWIRG